MMMNDPKMFEGVIPKEYLADCMDAAVISQQGQIKDLEDIQLVQADFQ